MTRRSNRMLVAFESAQLTYSEHPVDLYNSGINQLLSLAVQRGHGLWHFRMADLYRHDGEVMVRATRLESDPDHGDDPLEAWRCLRPAGSEDRSVAGFDIVFVRGDDIRHQTSPNVGLLRLVEDDTTVVESVAATLATCDKYELTLRCPDVPKPVTHSARTLEDALAAAQGLPEHGGWFVLKDRYGYGCGVQVHRLRLDTPGIEHTIDEYLRAYGDVLVQEYRPEVADGDIVATFFDDELIGAMRRLPAAEEWKTNASLGAEQVHHDLTAEQADAAWSVRRAFPECRLASVDLLSSAQVLEINAFPGADGLLQTHGTVLGELVLDRLEQELAGAEDMEGTEGTVR